MRKRRKEPYQRWALEETIEKDSRIVKLNG
jgi:hypothetical protein